MNKIENIIQETKNKKFCKKYRNRQNFSSLVKPETKVSDFINNEKHRFILNLLYRLRLTTGMVINLKVKDIRDNIMYCRGRRLYIPDSLMHDFYEFTHNKDPDDYLVKSSLDKKYSISSIQQIRKKFLKKLRKL